MRSCLWLRRGSRGFRGRTVFAVGVDLEEFDEAGAQFVVVRVLHDCFAIARVGEVDLDDFKAAVAEKVTFEEFGYRKEDWEAIIAIQ